MSKTLIDHVNSLSRYSDDTPDDIIWSILHNKVKMDDDTLLVYRVESHSHGNELNVMWGSGDGNKLDEWATQIAKENNCKKMYVITKRWRPFMRRFRAKPTAVILEREVQ